MGKKIIELRSFKADLFPEKISLNALREIWNVDGNEYSEKDLWAIREFGYLLLEAIVRIAKRKRENIVIPLNIPENENEKSDTVYPCEYGRAS